MAYTRSIDEAIMAGRYTKHKPLMGEFERI
jgi:hypothetical protein